MRRQGRAAPRDALPDLVRAFALIGISLVNVEIFATGLYGDYPPLSGVDTVVTFLVHTFFTAKAYPLFALMFGAGLGYLFEATQRRRDHRFQRAYLLRMAALGVLGAAHAVFFFVGDILLTYAVLGCVLLASRGFTDRDLLKLGLALIALQVALLATFSWLAGLTEPTPAQMQIWQAGLANEQAVFTTGTFARVAAFRLGELSHALQTLVLVQTFSVMGYFYLGLLLHRAGHLAKPRAPVWSAFRRWGTGIGGPVSLVAAWLVVSAPPVSSAQTYLGYALLVAGAPVMTFGIFGWLAWLSERRGRFLALVSLAGSASLSVYLLQSVLLSFIFSGYGLGRFGELSAATAIATGLAVALVTLLAACLWRLRFARGPLEAVLHRFVYPSSGA